MSKSLTTFTYRLDRTPSHWTEISTSLLSATASVVAATVVYQVITHSRTPVSGLWWAVLGALMAIASWRVSDTIGHAGRMLRGRAPVVDLERYPWRPGEPQRLRVANPDVRDLKSFVVTIEADEFLLAKVGAAAGGGSSFGRLLHRENVFSASGRDLITINRGLDLIARLSLPPHAEGKNWRWRVLVRCEPHKGPIRQYSFALPVDTTAIETAKAS